MLLLADPRPLRSVTLSIQFSHEKGHGLGPTLEFFTLVCRELQLRRLAMWRDTGAASDSMSGGSPTSEVGDSERLAPGASASPAPTGTGSTAGASVSSHGGDDESKASGDAFVGANVDPTLYVHAPQGLFPAVLPVGTLLAACHGARTAV